MSKCPEERILELERQNETLKAQLLEVQREFDIIENACTFWHDEARSGGQGQRLEYLEEEILAWWNSDSNDSEADQRLCEVAGEISDK